MKKAFGVTLVLLLTGCGGGGSTPAEQDSSANQVTPTPVPSAAVTPVPQPSGTPPPTQKSHQVKVSIVPANAGEVRLIPQKSSYQVGETVKVQSTAASGYLFNEISGVTLTGDEFSVAGDLQLQVSFVEDNKTVVTVSNNSELWAAF